MLNKIRKLGKHWPNLLPVCSNLMNNVGFNIFHLYTFFFYPSAADFFLKSVAHYDNSFKKKKKREGWGVKPCFLSERYGSVQKGENLIWLVCVCAAEFSGKKRTDANDEVKSQMEASFYNLGLLPMSYSEK